MELAGRPPARFQIVHTGADIDFPPHMARQRQRESVTSGNPGDAAQARYHRRRDRIVVVPSPSCPLALPPHAHRITVVVSYAEIVTRPRDQ